MHEHGVGLHRDAGVDDIRAASEVGAIRRGARGGREGLGAPVTVVAGVDEAELRHVGDELDLILARDPRREHAVGDGDRRRGRRHEAVRRHAGGAAGDLDAFIHAEETPRIIRGQDADESVVAGFAADVGSLDEAAEFEGGVTRAGVATDFKGAAAEGGDDAHLFGHIVIAVAVERERSRIEGDRGAIVPAALAGRAFGLGHREDARRIVEAKGAARTQLEAGVGDDVARVVGLDERTAEAAEAEFAEDFGRGRRQLAADVEGGTAVDDRRAGVILILQEDDRAATVAAGDVVVLVDAGVDRTDEQVGEVAAVLVGDDVGVAVAAEVEAIAAGAEAVGVARADPEGGAVIRTLETDAIVRATEEGRTVADLREIEVLRVDGVEVDRDRAGITGQAGGIGRVREQEVGEVLGAAEAADAEIDGREREVARDADDTEGAEARTDVELAGPAGRHVARGVELDTRVALREDVAAGQLGGVAERDERTLTGAEEGDATVLDEAAHGRPAVAADVERTPTLLVDRARARHRTRQRGVVIDRKVRIPGRREVTELGDVARATGDGEVGRAEGAAEDEILEEDRLVGHAEIEAGGTAVPSFVVERRILAEDERRRSHRLKRADDQVVRRMGRDEFEGFGAIAVITGVEDHIVQRDGRVIAQHVVPSAGAADDRIAASKRPGGDLTIRRLVPLGEVESAHAGLDDRARTGVGDDVARQGEARTGGVTELVTDAQGGGGLREVGRTRDGHAEHLLGIAATREGDPGGVDREVIDDRGGASGRTVDDRRHVRRAEVVEGGDGEVVTLARAKLLGVDTGHDFDADRVTEGKDAARERDGAGAEAQRVVDDESTADRAVRETRLDLAADVGGLDIAGVDGRATGVGVSAHFIADGKRRGEGGRA